MTKDTLSTEQHRLSAWSLEIVPSTEKDYVAQKWQNIEKNIGNESATSSWGWIDTWIKHFGQEVSHTYVFGNENGHPQAATILTNPYYTIRRGPFRMRSLFIGAAGERKEETLYLSDHRLLVSNEGRIPFAQAILGYASQIKWDQLLLQNMVPEDAEALNNAATAQGMHMNLQEVTYPVFDFKKARDTARDVVESLPQNKRRIKRNRKELTNQVGTLAGEWAQTLPQAQDIYQELVKLNQERWRRLGQPSAFPTPLIEQYYFDLMNALFDQNKVSLYRYRAGDTTLGCIYSIHDKGGVVVGYKSGLNFSEKIRKYAPGILTHVAYMDELWLRGYNQYDYGTGGDDYKHGIANAEDSLFFGSVYSGIKGKGVGFAREAYHAYKVDPRIEAFREKIHDTRRRIKRRMSDKVQ